MARTSTRERASFDPTVYPEEERVGESMLQRRIVEVLRPLLEWWLNVRRGLTAFVGADQFFYWRQYNPRVNLAPDIYVVPGVEPSRLVKSWKLWLDQVVPSFAFEIVSEDWEKDYREAPQRYDELGVPELVIFDPDYATNAERVRWQVYRRIGKRGLVSVEATNGDRVRSKSLGCWLRAVGEGIHLRVRIGEGARGDTLVPTAEERAQAEREQKEAERAARETALAEKDAALLEKETALAEKDVALARVAELEKQLRGLRARRRSRARD